MFPGESLVNERQGGRTASAEEECVNRNAGRAFPVGSNSRAVLGAGVRMSGLDRFAFGIGLPHFPDIALPVDQFLAGFELDVHAFPPDIAVGTQGAVCENGFLCAGKHRVLVGLHGGSGRDTEESVFRIDRIKSAVFAELHPGDIVADGLDFPAGNCRNEHGKVGLSAGGRESAGNIFDFAFRIGKLEDEHVFRHPAFIARLDGSNTESKALLAEDGVSAVSGTV